VETLARAVHAAHARGIVHRDLKPSNVMLTADGTPKIADFGLVKRLDDESGHTHTGEVLGTPSYMAPEQAEGKKNEIGPRTDIYALGAILYEMLAGKPPFEGASPLDAMRQVVTREPVHPSRFVPATPRDLEAICLKCLEKAPGHRYATALTLADDLRRFLDGQPVTARHLGPMGRFAKAIRRHPQAAALAVLLFILALVPVYLFADNYFTQRQIQRNNEEAERQRKLRAVELAPLVREILHRNCYECHGHDPKKVEKNLNILNYDHLLEKKRHVVVPGAPDDSLLIQRIDDGSMPPAELELRLPRVSEEERATLRDWILGGAPPLPRDDSGQAGLTTAPRSELAAQAKKIFHEHCYKCHEHRKAEGGIRIMHHRLLVTQRKVVIPGQPEQSKLYKRLITDDDEERMPPDFPLQPEEIEVVRRWIAEGALPFPKTD
jgi:mono/diheme cytochrome c family protein